MSEFTPDKADSFANCDSEGYLLLDADVNPLMAGGMGGMGAWGRGCHLEQVFPVFLGKGKS